MRVMTLVHGLAVGGAETMVAALARHLRSAGNDVEIGCLDEVGALGEDLRAGGFSVVSYGRRPGFDHKLPFTLARRFRRGGFDVLHAHQRTAFFYGLLAGLVTRAPLVYSEHGPPFPSGPSRRKKSFNRLLGRRARRITAVSAHLRHSLGAVEGLDAERIEIVPNAVDPGRFVARSQAARCQGRVLLGIPESTRVLGTVGRLVPVKNHRLLLYVLRELRGRLDDLTLVIIGEGPERRRLEALACELGIADGVVLTGERRDAEALLPAFDVFCLSSLCEGIPLTLLEAMAAGVPVVSTSVGGIPEAARPDQDALLVEGEPPDCAVELTDAARCFVESFAARVERILVEPGLGCRLAESARLRVADRFSMDDICHRYAEVLAAACSRRGGRT